MKKMLIGALLAMTVIGLGAVPTDERGRPAQTFEVVVHNQTGSRWEYIGNIFRCDSQAKRGLLSWLGRIQQEATESFPAHFSRDVATRIKPGNSAKFTNTLAVDLIDKGFVRSRYHMPFILIQGVEGCEAATGLVWLESPIAGDILTKLLEDPGVERTVVTRVPKIHITVLDDKQWHFGRPASSSVTKFRIFDYDTRGRDLQTANPKQGVYGGSNFYKATFALIKMLPADYRNDIVDESGPSEPQPSDSWDIIEQ